MGTGRPGTAALPHAAARRLLARLGMTIASLWVVVTGTFALMHAIPGEPFASRRLTPAIREHLMAVYGLALPLWRQYLVYWGNLLHGRLGWSMIDVHETVGQLIATGFPVSAALGLEALLWSVTGGAALGLLAAFRRGGLTDRAAMAAAVIGLAVPNFVVAAVVDYVFGVRWPILPVAGWGGFPQSVLPALSLGLASLALTARLLRAQGVEVLGMDHIRAARAKGLSWGRILSRHVLRNAALPLLSILGPMAASILTGSFVVEGVFAIPGLGTDYVTSVLDRDYPVILGLTIFYAALLLLFNLLVDVLYTVVDPRIRFGGEG